VAQSPAAKTLVTPNQASPQPVDPVLADRWNELVRGLIDAGGVSGLVRELAWQSVLVSLTPGEPALWRIRVEHEALRSPGLRDKLAPVLSQAAGQALTLELEAGVPISTPAQREAAERARRQRQAEQTIQDDPVVQELMAQFKSARIVPGSIKPL
jgi:DNA polymerase-3 subunit gamma/tau